MSYSAEEWMDYLGVVSNEEFVGYRNWGFTIYRTGYGPSSDQQWERLLQKIHASAHKDIMSTIGTTEEDPGFQQVWSLFRLDPRSDPALAGLDVDQLRDLYNSSESDQPMNTDYPTHRVFLFADDEALSDPNTSIIKCVDANYRPENYIPRNTRLGGQRYFGWMPMMAESVAELWSELNSRQMNEFAPLTIGGSHLVVWSADED